MPSSRKGHFVQVHRPVHQPGNKIEYADVEGRRIALTVSARDYDLWFERNRGWTFVSRELLRRKAVKYAKAYRNAGMDARVLRSGGGTKDIITDVFLKKG
jgi:hypothetical protein